MYIYNKIKGFVSINYLFYVNVYTDRKKFCVDEKLQTPF